MGWGKGEKLHCHDWLHKCHKFSECGGKVMLGAALLLLSVCWTAFIIWHERRGERRWIGTLPLIISFRLVSERMREKPALALSQGGCCRSAWGQCVAYSLTPSWHCCVLTSQQVAGHYYLLKTASSFRMSSLNKCGPLFLVFHAVLVTKKPSLACEHYE